MDIFYVEGPQDENGKKGKKGKKGKTKKESGYFTPMMVDDAVTGGSNKDNSTIRFQNKSIPFGLAMKRIKPVSGYECKKGNVLDESLFEKLFLEVAKIENREKPKKNNKTKRIQYKK